MTRQGNEEVALQALKLGASDYVVKSPGYLYRLPGVLENAFHMAELQERELRYRLLAENAQDTIFRYIVPENRYDYFSPALLRMCGYTPEELYANPELWREIVHPQDVVKIEGLIAGNTPPAEGLLIRWKHKDGRWVWTDQRHTLIFGADGALAEIHGIVRDISARRQAEEERDRMAVEKEEVNRRLKASYEQTIEGWAAALELGGHETRGHSQHVTELAVKLAAALGLSGGALDNVRRGSLLHDIGKLGVPDAILQKPGALTAEEWEIMRMHPTFGYQLLYQVEFLSGAMDIPYLHHERWDGSGYPHGLKGDEIPLAARIFAVADVWIAMNSARPYRPAWERAAVIRHLREQAGIKFDPRVVAALLEIVEMFNPGE